MKRFLALTFAAIAGFKGNVLAMNLNVGEPCIHDGTTVTCDNVEEAMVNGTPNTNALTSLLFTNSNITGNLSVTPGDPENSFFTLSFTNSLYTGEGHITINNLQSVVNFAGNAEFGNFIIDGGSTNITFNGTVIGGVPFLVSNLTGASFINFEDDADFPMHLSGSIVNSSNVTISLNGPQLHAGESTVIFESDANSTMHLRVGALNAITNPKEYFGGDTEEEYYTGGFFRALGSNDTLTFVVDSGDGEFDMSSLTTPNGPFRSFESITQAGNNTITLSNSTTFSARPWTVSSGTLRTNLALVPSNSIVNGTGTLWVDVNDSDVVSYAVASPNATLKVDYVGYDLGNITYNGTSPILGTLEVQSSGDGSINGDMIFNIGADKIAGNMILGSNTTLNVAGVGNTTLNGTVSGVGRFQVASGNLTLAGNLSAASANYRVLSNASINFESAVNSTSMLTMANNTVFRTTVAQSFGGVELGDSVTLDLSENPVTVSFNSDVTLNNSTIKLKLHNNQASAINANGTISMTNTNITVSGTPYAGNIVIMEGVELTRSNTEIEENFNYYDAELTQNESQLIVSMAMNSNEIGMYASTENQRKVASVLQILDNENPLKTAILALEGAAAEQQALSVLAGEAVASSKDIFNMLMNIYMKLQSKRNNYSYSSDMDRGSLASMLDNGNPLMVASLGNSGLLGSPKDSKAKIWASVLNGRSHNGYYKGYAGGKANTQGFVIGSDYKLDSVIFGGYFGFANQKYKSTDQSTRQDVDSYTFGVYGDWEFVRELYLRSKLMHSENRIDSRRSIVIGNFAASPEASYKGHTNVAELELAKQFSASNLKFEPFAHIGTVRMHIDAFSEQGGGITNNHVAANDDNYNYYGGGLRVNHKQNIKHMPLELFASAGYDYKQTDKRKTISVRMLGSDTYQSIEGQADRRSNYSLGFGSAITLYDKVQLGLSYDGEFAKASRSHTGNLNFKIWL